MPSLSSILSIASTALRTQQEAINAVAHNIANASTEGFSRQNPILGAKPGLKTPTGVFGTGVEIVDLQRVRDPYLDSAFRRESGALGENQARAGFLRQVETILSEPSDLGLSSALDEFFSAWSAFASNPTSTTARTAVRAGGQRLTDTMGRTAAGLDILRQETENSLLTDVRRVNELTDQIAQINGRIVAAEVGGNTAGGLRDTRDRAIDELATLLPVQVLSRESGTVGVVTSGISLVDGRHQNLLELRDLGGTYGVGLTGHPGLLPDQGGSIGGALRFLNVDLSGIRAELDDLAEAIVTEVNTIHQTGTNPDGLTGLDFFDPTAITASSFSLSADVLADLNAISAGTGGPVGEYRAGANDVALALASLRDTDSALLGVTYGEHFRQMTSDVGFTVSSALDLVEVHGTLADQAETRRTGYSGVSTDQELMRLIEYQTAYAAAARVVTVASEMMETLVRM
jgi:flagellar hook-associated protein 1 FlgK